MLRRIKWRILKFIKKGYLLRHHNIHIDKFTYGIPNVFFGREGKTELYIGKFCSIPHRRMTFMLGGEHNLSYITTFPLNMEFSQLRGVKNETSKGDIKVGNDVWFGINSTVLSGVTIGDGAVIGYGALVTKDVPAYAIVGGVPAKIIRYRFSEEQIDALLKIKWWEWSENKLINSLPLIASEEIDEFIENNIE